MPFEIPGGYELIGSVVSVETIARGSAVQQRDRLNRQFGKGRWRKLKGVGLVRFPDGNIEWAEIHWFEAHGIGRKEIKIKST
jgi:hypothetical protein